MASYASRHELLRESQRIFEAALEIDESSRMEFINTECHGNDELLALVRKLLDEFHKASDRISSPVIAADPQRDVGKSEFKGNSRFSPRRELGSGAFGTVYEVWDREQRTHVALKLLRTWKSDALFRFKKEFRFLSEVRHPNLVQLYELFSEGGSWFFTMELIEGSNFFDHVRPKAKAGEWEHVRGSLGQLVAGVRALHLANKVHRDLKPGNVLVSRTGRVVVLDFGLVREIDPLDANASMSLVGTPAYMAPEQVLTGHVTQASDWYSVGVMLFQTLTGRLPYSHPGFQAWADDNARIPTACSINPDVPQDLNDLCQGLLQRLPGNRPNADSMISKFGKTCPEKSTAQFPLSLKTSDFFVGRTSELQQLHSAFRDTQDGHLNVVLIEGSSGIGKSALVRNFLTLASDQYPNLLALKGKCYEFESVPYKGVDAVVDELSGYLQRLSEAEIQAVLPRDASLLPKLFPVLGRIKAVVRAPARSVVPDEQELRQRTFASFRELIARLTDHQPVILWIDDFQWADRDSSTLLADLCSPPHQPALLLLLTYRSEDIERNPTLQYLAQVLRSNNRLLGSWRQLSMQGLPEIDSRALLRQLIGASSDDGVLGTIVSEAGGHPLFLRELALLARTKRDLGGVNIDLDLQSVLRARISALSPLGRELLEFICLATHPLTQTVAFAACESESDERLSNALGTLVKDNLVRISGTGSKKRLEPFHDQVRSAVPVLMSSDQRKEKHRKLAAILSVQEGIEPQVLVSHYRESGDLRTAYSSALAAAEAAERQLAFDRAAVFYEAAIEMSDIAPKIKSDLYRKLADSLSKAGRGRDSALAYVKAAETNSDGIAFEMKRLAADQFMRSGYIPDGMRLFSELSHRVGIKIVRTPKEAIGAIVMDRVRTRIRLLMPAQKRWRSAQISDLTKLEMLRTGGVVLNIVDPVAAAYFQVKHVAEAFRCREGTHLAMAYAIEAGIRAAPGTRNPDACFSLLNTAQTIAEETENPNIQGFVYLCRAYVDYLLLHVPEGIRDGKKAIEFLRAHCTGVAWELTAAYTLLFWFKCWAGEVAEVRDLMPQLLKEGAARGDVNVEVSLRLLSGVHFAYLAADQSDECLAECESALDRWPKQSFTLQHYGAMCVQVESYLYRGEYARARRCLLEWWDKMAGSVILRWRVLRVMATFLCGRVALACWLDTRSDSGLRREIEYYSKRLQRIPSQWCPPMVAVLQAGLAAGNGNSKRAAELLNVAQDGFEKVYLHAFSSSAAHLCGALRGDAEGQIQMSLANEFMSSQKVRDPKAFMRMFIPGQWLTRTTHPNSYARN